MNRPWRDALSADVDVFSLHAGVRVDVRGRNRLEYLCRCAGQRSGRVG